MPPVQLDIIKRGYLERTRTHILTYVSVSAHDWVTVSRTVVSTSESKGTVEELIHTSYRCDVSNVSLVVVDNLNNVM